MEKQESANCLQTQPPILEIDSASKQINFFTDPKGIFSSCPEIVKEILLAAKEGEELNADEVVVTGLKLPVKKTGNNFCSHFFSSGTESYYVCQQCSYTSGSFSTMCFCQGCWEPEKHVGHSTYSQVPYSDGAYCDCGRIQRIKKESFCQHHSEFATPMACQIAEHDRKVFVDSFIKLIEVALQRESTMLLHNICRYLEELNENSIFYNRLTFQVLNRVCANKNQHFNQKYLLVLLKKNCDFNKLMIHLGGDLLTRVNIIKLICSDSDDGRQNAFTRQLTSSIIRELVNLTAVETLLNSGFYHQFLLENVKSADNSKDKPRVLSKLLESKVMKAQNLNEISQIQHTQLSPQLAEKVLHKLIEFYPSTSHIQKFIKCESEESNPWGQFQQAQSLEERHENLPFPVKNAHNTIATALSIIFIGYKGQAQEFRSYLKEIGFNLERLEEILYWMTLSVKQICFLEDLRVATVPFLLLLCQSPAKEVLLSRFWQTLLRPSGSDNQEVSIKKVVDSFHYVIVTILRADIFTLIHKKKLAKVFKLQDTESVESSREKVAMQNWFRSFLYERKAISRSQIIQLKSEGVLNFQNAGKILNQMCSYNQQQQMFNFNNLKAFKNILNQFPLMPSQESYESMYSNNIRLGQSITLQQNSISSVLLASALNTKAIIDIAETEWKKSLVNEAFAQGQEKYGYLYLFLLVVYDMLTNGKDESLRSRLELIRKNPECINEYTSFDNQKQKIRRLLNIDQQNEAKPENKEESMSVKKMLSEQKKKKIAEKYLRKRELVLQTVRSLNDGKIDDEEELCILCHQRQKPNNQLVYLSTLMKNNTIAGAIHGRDNIPNTYISTCFHAVHINCYISYRKNTDMTFNCPLCQVPSNCILPTNYSKDNIKLNRICKNVMIANMVTAYQIFDVESDFILLFKHLVESKGLNSLLQSTRYELKKKIWIKSDDFLKDLMIDIYETSNEEKKKDHLKSIQDFILEIDSCPRRECLLVQLLFAEGLKEILTEEKTHSKVQKLLVQIRSALEEDEFIIIHEQICRLMENQFSLPDPTADELAQKKVRLSFELVELPEKATECQKRYTGKKCDICEQPNEYLCLLCNKLVGSNCRESHSKTGHNETIIYLATDSLKVELARKNYYTNEDIYENQFKISFSERGDYEEMGNEEQYYLNDIKLQKLIGNFLEN